LLPGFHVPRVLWMTGQKSVPVLVLDGETIYDSTRISERRERMRPAPALYPAEAAARRRAPALEDFFDEEFGPHVRRGRFPAPPFAQAPAGPVPARAARRRYSLASRPACPGAGETYLRHRGTSAGTAA